MKTLIVKIKKSIKRNKLEIYIAASILISTMIIGFVVNMINPSLNNINDNQSIIKDLSSKSIILNNLRAILYLVIGNLNFGLSTAILLAYNGFFSGMMLGMHGMRVSIFVILIKTIPHGIFELPAIVFAGAIGLKTISISIKALRTKKIYPREEISDSLVLLGITFVLIIVAGIVEGQIVPLLVKTAGD